MFHTRSRAGFTLVQLLVSIGIILFLAAILLPAISRARAHARLAICSANLNQISAAFTHWGHDKGLVLPEAIRWTSIVNDAAAGEQRILYCPEADASQGPDVLAIPWFGTWKKPMKADPQGSRNNANNDWRIIGEYPAAPYTIEITYHQGKGQGKKKDWLGAIVTFRKISPGVWEAVVERADQEYRTDIIVSDGTRYRDIQPGDIYGPIYSLPPSNYAYNGLADNVRNRRARSALVMDSHKIILVPDDLETLDTLRPELAPRHMRQVNVLYSDGSVELTSVESLDPEDGIFLVRR